jgi:hypothetical protein
MHGRGQCQCQQSCAFNLPANIAYLSPVVGRFDGMKAFENDPNVGAIVVTGAGRGFCAGADMAGLGSLSSGKAMDTPPDAVPARVDNRTGTSIGRSQRTWASGMGLCYCGMVVYRFVQKAVSCLMYHVKRQCSHVHHFHQEACDSRY